MTCISLAFWWYLATLGPTPTLVARFPTEAACQTARAELTHRYTLTGRIWTRRE